MFLAPCKDIQTPHTHIHVKGSSLYSVRDPLASFTNLIHSSHYFFEPVSPETLALSRAEQITQPHKVKPQTERRGGAEVCTLRVCRSNPDRRVRRTVLFVSN